MRKKYFPIYGHSSISEEQIKHYIYTVKNMSPLKPLMNAEAV